MEAPQRFGHFTILEAYRDDKNVAIRQEICLLKRKLQFLVAISLPLIKCPRETSYHHITLEQRIADLDLPVLSGLEPFCVQPRIHPVTDEALVQFMDGFPVAVRVYKEDARFLLR